MCVGGWYDWQGELVSNMRYLASVVTQCFTAFGELLALHKRFVELSGGIARCDCLMLLLPPCQCLSCSTLQQGVPCTLLCLACAVAVRRYVIDCWALRWCTLLYAVVEAAASFMYACSHQG